MPGAAGRAGRRIRVRVPPLSRSRRASPTLAPQEWSAATAAPRPAPPAFAVGLKDRRRQAGRDPPRLFRDASPRGDPQGRLPCSVEQHHRCRLRPPVCCRQRGPRSCAGRRAGTLRASLRIRRQVNGRRRRVDSRHAKCDDTSDETTSDRACDRHGTPRGDSHRQSSLEDVPQRLAQPVGDRRAVPPAPRA